MPRRAMWTGLALGAFLGAVAGAGAGYVAWGHRASAAAARLASLESTAAEVAGERERLRRELAEIVRERKDLVATAERLRAQVEEQVRRLETLSAELAPPAGQTDRPTDAPP